MTIIIGAAHHGAVLRKSPKDTMQLEHLLGCIMDAKQQGIIIFLLIVCLLLSSCGPGQVFGPTFTPSPTSTPTRTPTPTPMRTPTRTPMPIAFSIPGVVLYYPFSGNANDMSGNQNDGQVIGATLTTDRFGISNCAYYFDGEDDYIAFDPTKMPMGDSPRTISAWVKVESYPPELFPGLGSRPTVIGWGLQDWDQLSEMQIVDGSLQFHTYNLENKSSKAELEFNQWYHLAIVYTEGKVYLYINGVEEEYQATMNNTQLGTGRVGTWPEPHLPVANWWENLGYFHGIIDDIAVYNLALTKTQIGELYKEGGWGE